MEDDKAARKAIAAILKRHAFAVCEATTVAEAIEALATRPQWILLDLMLPDGSGIDVLHHLSAVNLRTRVCIITGCSREMQNEALAAGAEQSFAKPLDVERLICVMTA